MCYGPEIKSIFECMQKEPGLTVNDLKERYQYKVDGDIKSLIDGVLIFLRELDFIEQENEQYYVKTSGWSSVALFIRLNEIVKQSNEDSLNYVFASLYDKMFVKPDKLFMNNLHYQINSNYEKTLIGHEKINAWKRIMECYGLGRRVYSGFYALPRLEILTEIILEIGPWEGPLHQYCEKHVNLILPCMTNEGNVFKGLLYGLNMLSEKGIIEINNKQDLPYKSYGPDHMWNWIKTERGGEDNDSLH
jgi:hypothetical protein